MHGSLSEYLYSLEFRLRPRAREVPKSTLVRFLLSIWPTIVRTIVLDSFQSERLLYLTGQKATTLKEVTIPICICFFSAGSKSGKDQYGHNDQDMLCQGVIEPTFEFGFAICSHVDAL
jgi:hypothetical protein